MTPQELKNSILQLAIQGKLVEQREDEGTAKELYKQIQAEKKRLLKVGKIKKEKPLPEIKEEEKPFDIPDSWMWVRFNEIGSLLDGTNLDGFSFPYLEAKYLRGKAEAKYKNSGKFINKGTRVILVDGENSGEVFNIQEDGYMGSTFRVLYISSVLYSHYALYYLLLYKTYYRNRKKGAAIPHLNKELFFNMPFPLPPLAEQRRIVAKIEELMPYVERYEKAWSKLEELNKRFPSEMQKSILQFAIQGKLVEQREDEGTAEVLYKQIQAEKKRLIKAGKIKKEKPLPEIKEDEKPFDIPEGWMWVRLGDMLQIINGDRGKSYPSKDKLTEKDTGIPFISALNIENKTVPKDSLLFLSEEQYEKLGSGKLILGDLVLCIRGSLGKNGRYPYKKGAIASSLVILRSFIDSDDYYEFLMKYINSGLFTNEIIKYNNGTAQPNLGARDLAKFIVPLPPLAEQKRIVAKIEELMPLCERLKFEYS